MCGRLKHHESKHDQNAMHFTVRIGTLHFSAKLGKAKSVLPRLGERNPKQSQPANSNPSLMRQRTAIADGPSLLGTRPLIPPHTRATLPSMTHRHPNPRPWSIGTPLPAMMRPKMTQNDPESPTFLRNHQSRAGCEPSATPDFPSRQCSQLRNATKCDSLQHIFRENPLSDGLRPNPNRRCLAPIPATPPNDDAHGDGTASGGRLLCKWPLSCINITLPSNT